MQISPPEAQWEKLDQSILELWDNCKAWNAYMQKGKKVHRKH